MLPVKRWRHRHRVLSLLSVIAVPVLLVLTLANWRYRFEFERGGAIGFPESKSELNGWRLLYPDRIRVGEDAGDPMLHLEHGAGEESAMATYPLPSMDGAKFVRVHAVMRCYGKHRAPGWKRARIQLLGYDGGDKPLFKYPHELGFLDGEDGWQVEDAIFQLAPEMRRLELRVIIKETSNLQIKKLKVQVARERRGLLAYRPVTVMLGGIWLFTLALVARAYGGTRIWWRACLVSIIIITGFVTLVYPAIRRSVRPPLSKRFHAKSTFVWERRDGIVEAFKSPTPVDYDSSERRVPPRFSWLNEHMAGIHVLLYSCFALVVCLAAWSWKSFWLVGGVALLQEARQIWIDHSSDWGDLMDLTLDALGLGIGVGGFLVIRHLISRSRPRRGISRKKIK